MPNVCLKVDKWRAMPWSSAKLNYKELKSLPPAGWELANLTQYKRATDFWFKEHVVKSLKINSVKLEEIENYIAHRTYRYEVLAWIEHLKYEKRLGQQTPNAIARVDMRDVIRDVFAKFKVLSGGDPFNYLDPRGDAEYCRGIAWGIMFQRAITNRNIWATRMGYAYETRRMNYVMGATKATTVAYKKNSSPTAIAEMVFMFVLGDALNRKRGGVYRNQHGGAHTDFLSGFRHEVGTLPAMVQADPVELHQRYERWLHGRLDGQQVARRIQRTKVVYDREAILTALEADYPGITEHYRRWGGLLRTNAHFAACLDAYSREARRRAVVALDRMRDRETIASYIVAGIPRNV